MASINRPLRRFDRNSLPGLREQQRVARRNIFERLQRRADKLQAKIELLEKSAVMSTFSDQVAAWADQLEATPQKIVEEAAQEILDRATSANTGQDWPTQSCVANGSRRRAKQ